MAEARSTTQLPLGNGVARSIVDEELAAFRNGIELGQKYADLARRKVAAWAEEHPGQLLLAGLAAGFVIGKILLRPARVRLEDLED